MGLAFSFLLTSPPTLFYPFFLPALSTLPQLCGVHSSLSFCTFYLVHKWNLALRFNSPCYVTCIQRQRLFIPVSLVVSSFFSPLSGYFALRPEAFIHFYPRQDPKLQLLEDESALCGDWNLLWGWVFMKDLVGFVFNGNIWMVNHHLKALQLLLLKLGADSLLWGP